MVTKLCFSDAQSGRAGPSNHHPRSAGAAPNELTPAAIDASLLIALPSSAARAPHPALLFAHLASGDKK